MESPDSVPEAADAAAESTPARRIAIGTQRAGAKPPTLGPKYQYISPPAAKPVTAGPADASAPEESAATSVTPPAATTASPSGGPPATPAGGRDRGGRGRRRERDAKPSFTDVLPPTKRVAVPSLRGGLDEDLEADYEAALGGLEVDALLATATAARVDAPLDPGARVTGTVLSVGADTAFIDLGGNRQGALKLAPLLDKGLDLPEVGASLEVSVGSRNDDDNLYEVAPANHAVAIEDWSQIQAGMIVEARVTAANKGGLECEVAGLRGFMPASLVSTWRVENLEELVGQTLESLVTDIVPAARRLVLSRRAVIEKQAADARATMLETLEPGTELEGIVRSVRDFGAFVDIGSGVEGLVHVSELSWERVANPADVLQPGQKVRVIVKRIDPQTGKIGLSARDLIESPWKRAAVKYHVGATVKGVVSKLAQFGAFVKLEPGIEGLVHVSELATRHIRSVADVVREGQEIECRVLAIDPDEQRLSLSVKALTPKPASQSGAAVHAEPAAEEPAPPPVVKKRTSPLKGGLGSDSQGAKFGLKW
ncbi:MAG: S1 RNA-binding domain-containing protein [Planctomycetaceae bacterium]